jgi:PRC-barrel domain protein
MLAKYLVAGLAGSALLASVALAQSPTATTDSAKTTAAATDTSSSFQGNWRTSKLAGLSVGSINDLLMEKGGNIKAVVIGVGGFLGVGERLVAVPFEKVKFSTEPVAYTGMSGTPNAGGGARPPTNTGPSTTTGAAPSSNSSAMSKPNPWYPDHAVYSASKDELKAMPEFKYSTQ